MIGPFPWEPFPPGEPEPKGPDPMQSLAYRSAVTASDAYRSVRLAVRPEGGALRLGNRFVADGRYREVALLAFGRAAYSMALAALHALGDRITQGFLAGPEPAPPELPFRGLTVPPGWGGAPHAGDAVNAAIEIAGALTEQDLLLVLLSPGAIRALAMPPPGQTCEEFARLLEGAHAAGATGREVDLLGRVLGSGAVGGRLAGALARADATTLIVERGEGPLVVGGGPMQPVAPAERVEARSVLARVGLVDEVPPPALDGLAPGAEGPLAGVRRRERPVLVAGPGEALRAAADALFDKGWTSRLAFLGLPDGPEEAADRFLARSDDLVQAEGPAGRGHRTKGVATFAMLTLGLPEGVDDGPALGQFLGRASATLRRREMSVGLFRTAGAPGNAPYPAGAVVGSPVDADAGVPRGRARAVPMRAGITDVGLLAVSLTPVTRTFDRSR